MTTLDIQSIREELCNVLRNGNVLSTTVRGVTTVTEDFVATASQTVFVLTNSGVRNIRSVTVDSVAKYIITDWTIVWSTKTLTLLVGASVGVTVSIQYDYGSSDKIFPDMPRESLTLTSYPRVGIEITSISTTPLGIGGDSHISDILITIFAWVPANKDTAVAGGIGGTESLSDLMTAIRGVIRSNAKSFQGFNWVSPTGCSPVAYARDGKVLQQSMDFSIKFKVE